MECLLQAFVPDQIGFQSKLLLSYDNSQTIFLNENNKFE